MGAADNLPWSKQEFEAELRAKGKRYHIYHPFHIAMNSGKCTREQANMPDRDQRRQWIQRILDHDGTKDQEGGIEAWLRLAEACGLKREDVTSLKYVLPGVRFAVDAYVNFARRAPWQEAACSSLTELFAPEIHQKRLEGWPVHYPWIDADGYAYFRKRLSEARRDVEHGLQITLDYFKTRAEQERALGILQFKLDVLWCMLDAMQINYGIGEARHV